MLIPKNISTHAKFIKRARHLALTIFYFNSYEIQFLPCSLWSDILKLRANRKFAFRKKPVWILSFSVKVTVTHSDLSSSSEANSNEVVMNLYAITAMMSLLGRLSVTSHVMMITTHEKPVLASVPYFIDSLRSVLTRKHRRDSRMILVK